MYIFCREYFHHDSNGIVKYILRLIEKKYRVFSSSTTLPRQFIDLRLLDSFPFFSFYIGEKRRPLRSIKREFIVSPPSIDRIEFLNLAGHREKYIAILRNDIYKNVTLYANKRGHAELLIIMNDRRRSKIRCREGGPLGSYFIPISSPVPRLIDIFFHTRLSLNSSSVDLRPVPLSRSPSPFTPSQPLCSPSLPFVSFL